MENMGVACLNNSPCMCLLRLGKPRKVAFRLDRWQTAIPVGYIQIARSNYYGCYQPFCVKRLT